MQITVLDDYQDAVRKLDCAQQLDGHDLKIFNNTVKGVGQLSVRLRDTQALVLIRDRTALSRQLLENAPSCSSWCRPAGSARMWMCKRAAIWASP